jgi:hypothetical protein
MFIFHFLLHYYEKKFQTRECSDLGSVCDLPRGVASCCRRKVYLCSEGLQAYARLVSTRRSNGYQMLAETGVDIPISELAFAMSKHEIHGHRDTSMAGLGLTVLVCAVILSFRRLQHSGCHLGLQRLTHRMQRELVSQE